MSTSQYSDKSSFSFSKIFTSDELRIAVSKNDTELIMNVFMTRESTNRESRLKTVIEFGNGKVKIEELDRTDLAELSKYYLKISQLVPNRQHAVMKGQGFRGFIASLKNIIKLGKKAGLFQELRALTVYTKLGSGQVVARTTIELDADIITIIGDGLLNTELAKIMLRLHMANVFLANYYFGHQLKAVVSVLKNSTWIVEKIRFGGYLHTMINITNTLYSQTTNSFTFENLLLLIMPAVISTLAWKFFPRMIIYRLISGIITRIIFQGISKNM